MSTRIFFAGAAGGVIVGALAVVAFQAQRASPPIAENAPTATVSKETTSRSNTSPERTPEKVVQSAGDLSVPATSEPPYS